MRRRSIEACVAAALAVVAGGLHAAGPVPDATDGERREVMRSAEAVLARGDAVAALAGFERAGAMAHAADGEMGVVRALLQQGEYRKAVALCAHVAGAHLDTPEAAVLYAWTLRLGGQLRESERVLAEVAQRAPSNPVVRTAVQALATRLPIATGALLDAPHRMAPAASQRLPGEVVASAVLLDDGRTALMPALPAASVTASRWWVRNGLGQTSEATLDPASGPTGDPVRILRLSRQLAVVLTGASGTAATFAGSPAFVAEFAETESSAPAWPWLRIGFTGSPRPGGPMSRLNVDLAGRHLGGPVFNAAGEVTAIAVRGADGQAQALPVAAWPVVAPPDASFTADAASRRAAGGSRSPDEIYELALRRTLQVVAAP